MLADHIEGLRTRDFVDQVQPDEQLGLSARERADCVRIPDFVKKRLHKGFTDSIPDPPIRLKPDPRRACVKIAGVTWAQQLAEYRGRFGDFLRGAALGRYEQELRKQTAELNDLFLLLCFMEATALPNPATLYLLEIYPYLLEEFHVWHRRMGIEHSPVGSLPCC
jgi:hypothetical protein